MRQTRESTQRLSRTFSGLRINDQWRVVSGCTDTGRTEFDRVGPLGLTQKPLADHLACDVKVINRIVNGPSAVTAEMALKLGATFQTSPEFWPNAQEAVDIYRASQRLTTLPTALLKAN